jgi:hypothetical protein
VNYPTISSLSQSFEIYIANCSAIQLSPVDGSALTQVVYNLFDPAYIWSYYLQGHFDVCNKVVSVSVSDFLTGLPSEPTFTATYFSANDTIDIKLET